MPMRIFPVRAKGYSPIVGLPENENGLSTAANFPHVCIVTAWYSQCYVSIQYLLYGPRHAPLALWPCGAYPPHNWRGEEGRDTSRNRGPRAGAPFLFLFDRFLHESS